MPDFPQPPEGNDPNKIDISLSMMGDQSGIEFRQFLNELRSLRTVLGTLVTDAQKAVQEASRLHQQYQGQGQPTPQSGGSPRVLGPDGIPVGMSSGAATAEATVERLEAVQPSGPIARKRLSRFGRLSGRTIADRNLAKRQGLSSGASRPPDALDDEEMSHDDEPDDSRYPGRPLQTLHYGEYTPQELLNQIARGAYKLDEKFTDGGSFLRSAGGYAEGLANTMPYQQLARQYLGRIESHGVMGYNVGPQSGAAIGQYDYGADPNKGPLNFGPFQGGNFNLGPLHTRLPILNNPFLTNLQQEWDRFKGSFSTAGYNQEQSKFVQEQLVGMGLKPSDQLYGQMRGMGRNLFSQGAGAFAQNPETYRLLEQSTRLGSTSIKDYTDLILKLNDAFSNSGFSVSQILADLEALGQQFQQMGGLKQSGVRLGADWLNMTGQSPQILSSALQDPFVTSTIAAQTGLPPQMQGAAPPDLLMRAPFQAVQNLIPGISAGLRTKKVPIGNTGAYETISKQDQLLAQLHMLMPDMDPETLKWLADPEKRREMLGADDSVALFRQQSKELGATGTTRIRPKQLEDALTRMDGSRTQGRRDLMKIFHDHPGTSAAAATARYKEAMKLAQQHKPKDGSETPQVRIELGQNAKHAGFSLWYNDAFKKWNKGQANAGQSAPNKAYSGSYPTQPPILGPGGP